MKGHSALSWPQYNAYAILWGDQVIARQSRLHVFVGSSRFQRTQYAQKSALVTKCFRGSSLQWPTQLPRKPGLHQSTLDTSNLLSISSILNRLSLQFDSRSEVILLE